MQARWALPLAALITLPLGCRDRGESPLRREQVAEATPRPGAPPPSPGPLQVPPSTREAVSFQEGFAPIVERVSAAVVNVSSVRFVRPPSPERVPFFSNPFFHEFFGPEWGGGPPSGPRVQREQSLGSGVIVSREGHVLTNAHVVEGASQVRVTVPGRPEVKASVVGVDAKTDVAVLKLDGGEFAFAAFGDSEAARVGDFALAIGNPFGIGQTVTLGIISAVGRGNMGIVDYEDFLQTDAAINPGNSGGALINMAGELIGINTAILARGAQGNQGIGFAVPSKLARAVMEQILEHGRVIRGALGVAIQDASPPLVEALGLPKDTRGAVVSDVAEGSAAEEAGLRRGDVIVAMNGEHLVDGRDLRMRVAETKPGTRVTLRVLRDGKSLELAATLDELPEPKREAPAAGPAPSSALGIEIAPLSDEARRRLEIPGEVRGALVVGLSPDSPAGRAGLLPGDVIVEVNQKPVAGPEQVKQAVEAAGKRPVLLVAWREGRTRFVLVER
ncbi:serine protease [Sorangium cellulosum]|uniref:Serine protease n=1 Tax=Sorangium cellulosum TaxID=56 RepID=A0A4P2QED8_SORCE|nr:DegQ family serine endoprotease [Sorangium cellulosum]AUX27543.1 serine protease [Sorangium cellulosum]